MTKKALNTSLLFLLLVSYCLTLPLLTIIHFHELHGVTGEVSIDGSIPAKHASSNHPIYCDICSRLHSSQVFSDHFRDQSISLTLVEFLLPSEIHPPVHLFSVSFHGRAPPDLPA